MSVQGQLWERERVSSRVEIAPGAIWLRAFLTLDEQKSLASQSRALLDGPAGGYVPIVRGGGRMRVRMLCLGRHWNAMTYRYGQVREDFDHQPVPPLPEAWGSLATRTAALAGFTFAPDICIVNAYEADGRMGLHQDKGEGTASLDAGVPVVSFSIGDTARFLFGGLSRRDTPEVIHLESGDAFVFGGPARLRYHGVSRIFPGTSPAAIGTTGRVNLTFRQY